MSHAVKVAQSVDPSACSALNTFRFGSTLCALRLAFDSQLVFEFTDAEVVMPRDAA